MTDDVRERVRQRDAAAARRDRARPEGGRLMPPRPVDLTPTQAVACCSPLAGAPMSEEHATRVAPLLKALADPVRLRLMSMVLSHEGGEACVCDLNDAFDLSQPTISHHLKVLHDAGLLDREKRGVWVYYQAKPAAMQAIMRLFATAGTTC